MIEQFTKKDIEELNKKFNDNFPVNVKILFDGEVSPYRLDIHKEKTEKYVGKLCQYLATIKGYKYWPNVKKRSAFND